MRKRKVARKVERYFDEMNYEEKTTSEDIARAWGASDLDTIKDIRKKVVQAINRTLRDDLLEKPDYVIMLQYGADKRTTVYQKLERNPQNEDAALRSWRVKAERVSKTVAGARTNVGVAADKFGKPLDSGIDVLLVCIDAIEPTLSAEHRLRAINKLTAPQQQAKLPSPVTR